MKLTRRAVLKLLPAAALAAARPSFGSVRGGSEPVSLVGLGGAGHRILRRFVQRNPESRESCCVDLVERRGAGNTVTFATDPIALLHEGLPRGPHVVVAGLGYVPGGESSFEFASMMRYGGCREVRGVLVLPFAFEGTYRERGLAQAARFVQNFPDTLVIDNEWYYGEADGESLLDIYGRANDAIAEALAVLAGLR